MPIDPAISGLPQAATLTGDEIWPIYQNGQRVATTLRAACITKAAFAGAPILVGLPGAGVITGAGIAAVYQNGHRKISTIAAITGTRVAFAGEPQTVSLRGALTLTGAELVPMYQAGQLVLATVDQIAAFAGGGAPTVTLSASIAKAEGNSGANLYTYTVTRSSTVGAVSVPWSFTPGNTSADDFTGGVYPAGGSVALADGQASGSFSVSVNGDTIVEGDETFNVYISTPNGYVAGASTSATGTILNDDLAMPGAAPTTPSGLAPSIQYHPHTATLTMRPDSTFSGYIVPIAGARASTLSMLVVTAWNGSTCQALKNSIVLTAGGAAQGTTIVSAKADEGANTGAGGTGRYLVTGGNQTVGSAGSPVTFTAAAQQVVGISDLKGRADLSSSDSKGPELKVDDYGRKYLRFAGEAAVFEWLRNLSVTGLDTHNIAWFLVGRFLGAGKSTQGLGNSTVVSTGAFENGSVPAQTAAMGISLNFPTNPMVGISTSTPIVTAKRMVIGQQMQVVGTSTTTADGVGGSATACTGRIWLNETSVSQNSSPARGINVQGLTIGSRALAAGSNNNASFDLYELNGYVLGELGTPSTSQARGDAIVSTMMNNWNIAPIAKQVVFTGDSRTEWGIGVVSGTPNDGTGVTIPYVFSAPSPSGIANNVRVTSWAAAGEGVGYATAYLDKGFASFANGPCPMHTDWMLGGGNDVFAFLSGGNDTGVPESVGGKWPNTTGGALGGNFAAGSDALISELYNGSGYTTTFSATVSANSAAVTPSGMSPAFMYDGMLMSGAGWTPGSYALAYTSGGGGFNLGSPQVTALSGVATTATLGSYQNFIGRLLARGFKGVWLAEWQNISPKFRAKVIANGLADAQAGPGQTYDGKLKILDTGQITVGSKAAFGADFTGYGMYNFDLIHLNPYGKSLIVSGGDTPQYGYAASIKALLAL